MRENRLSGIMTDRNIKLMLYFISIGFFGFFGVQLNTPPVLDEVGTIANTAWMVGYDWSQCSYTMGAYYYKYGMSLLYYPLMLLIENPYLLYKGIMLLNTALLGTIPVFAFVILRKHFGVEKKLSAAAIALAVGWLPSVALYTLYARADMLMIFLPWPITLCLLELYDASNNENGKRRAVIHSILLGFLTVYAFMAHTRGVVFIIASVMTVAIVQLLTRKRTVKWLWYCGSTIVFLLLDRLLGNIFYDAVYGKYGTQHASVESFDFEYLLNIFSKSGLLSMIKLALGWLYNVLTSTYGLAGIALIGGLLLLAAYLRKRHSVSEKELIVAVFGLLNFMGTFAMGCLFFFPVAHKYYTGFYVDRGDRLIYGRYTVCTVGILVLLALYILIYKKDVLRLRGKLAAAAGYIATLVFFIWKAAPYLEGVSCVSRYFISLCSFLELEKAGTTVDAFPNIKEALLYAGILGFVIFAVILAASFMKRKVIFISIFILLASISIYSINYYKIRLSRDEVLLEWTDEPVSLMRELTELADEYPILKDTSAKDIKHYQYPCKEFVVGSYCTVTADADNCFIIAKKKYFVKDYYDNDYYTFDCFDYTEASRDIVYVKGEELKNRLEELGYSMTKYEGKLKSSPVSTTLMDKIK